ETSGAPSPPRTPCSPDIGPTPSSPSATTTSRRSARWRPARSSRVFPPSAAGRSVIRVTAEPLSADALADAVAVPEAGGVAVFLGIVRNNAAGRPVVALEYEAHVPMAEAKMKEIGEAVYRRWPDGEQVARAPP